jgi:hypothetical protein
LHELKCGGILLTHLKFDLFAKQHLSALSCRTEVHLISLWDSINTVQYSASCILLTTLHTRIGYA